jgi:hypothetical protein
LETNYSALREALKQHLSEVSKKTLARQSDGTRP